MRPACVWSEIFLVLKRTKDGPCYSLWNRSWAHLALFRRQSGFKHLVGSHVPTNQHLWLLARSVVRTAKIFNLPFSFRKDEESHVAMLVARSPLVWVSPNTELLCCRCVVLAEPLRHQQRPLNFQKPICSWKTVIDARCPPAQQSYRCHVVFWQSRGVVQKQIVNSRDCHSEFHHRAPQKRTPLHCQGPTPTRFSVTARRWNTLPNFGKNYLDSLAQGAGHEVSADWLAAGPKGPKKPRTSPASVLLLLSSATSRSFFVLLCFSAGTSSPLLFFFTRSLLESPTRLRVLLLHFPAACSQRHSSFSGDRSIMGAFPPSSLSGSLSSEAPYFFSNKSASRRGAPQASYYRRRHRNCFSTRPEQLFPKK